MIILYIIGYIAIALAMIAYDAFFGLEEMEYEPDTLPIFIAMMWPMTIPIFLFIGLYIKLNKIKSKRINKK